MKFRRCIFIPKMRVAFDTTWTLSQCQQDTEVSHCDIHTPICIDGAKVEMIKTIMFLAVNIMNK